ncbi:MAG TPA: class I SAM-dependent methyltransferase [Anaerolineae bacterium]|nr:class I SAM-dependent methyltransferase [Anaerolineae bacterium]
MSYANPLTFFGVLVLAEDRSRWNEKYRNEPRHALVNPNLIRYAPLLKTGRVLDLAGGLGQNGEWLMSYSSVFRAVNCDISDEALRHASKETARVLADAGALPFANASFDTILCIRFFDPRVSFHSLLKGSGTVFFETLTTADEKYRPDFNPAHRFDLATIPQLFAQLKILLAQETDDGHRVYATVIARK